MRSHSQENHEPFLCMSRLCLVKQDFMISFLPTDVPFACGRLYQRCTISIFRYQFNINYSFCCLININTNINYFKAGLSISIPYQFFQKFPYRFQYQFMLSISLYDIVNITNCLSISHCYQYQY